MMSFKDRILFCIVAGAMIALRLCAVMTAGWCAYRVWSGR